MLIDIRLAHLLLVTTLTLWHHLSGAVNRNCMHTVVWYGLYRYLPVLLGIEAQYLTGINLYGHIAY